MKNVCLLGILVVVCVAPMFGQQNSQQGSPAAPQAASDQSDNAALLQKIRDLEDRVILLEGQVRTLKSQEAPPAPAPAPQPGAEAQAQAPQAPTAPAESAAQAATPPTATATSTQTQAGILGGAGGSAAKALNPDISAIGD